MKRIVILTVFIAFSTIAVSQETAMSKFAFSLNPLGFVQFGPIVNAEFGLSDNLVLNTHVRFSSLGVLSYVVNAHEDGLDELSGVAFGGGPIYFFGENKSKPYCGFVLEYDKSKMLYAKDELWEWDKTSKTIVFAFNGGYRFRFEKGFFLNTGVYLGAGISNYTWDYSNASYGLTDNSSRDGKSITAFGMLEATFGIEF